jgi:hypothetical protein
MDVVQRVVVGVGGMVLGWLFQSQWGAPDPGMMAVTLVAGAGAAGLIAAPRTIVPVRA